MSAKSSSSHLRVAIFLSVACNTAQAVTASNVTTVPSPPECVEEAADFHKVNSWVLRAIIWQESSNRPAIISRNENGSVDIGLGQINSIHFSELGRFQVQPAKLLDGCINTYVAAWLLAKQVQRHGNTWEAVGAYHSETPKEKWRYAKSIYDILRRWGIEDGQSKEPNAQIK